MSSSESGSEIAFFDLETTKPPAGSQSRALLEFGAILVCPRKLEELKSYSSLVRPSDPSFITSLPARSNGITPDAILSAPYFSDISDTVFNLLDGRIWAGHNIVKFDCERIKEAFKLINRAPPEPKDIIDSLPLLTQKFGKRAGDMKMATLASYFGLGQQTHRSLDDVRMNLKVLKYCATLLFVESSLPNIFSQEMNIESRIAMEEDPVPAEISPTAAVTQGCRSGSDDFMKPDDVSIQIHFSCLKVRFGIRTSKYVDYAGRPRVNFVVDVPPSLCKVLDACDGIAQKMSLDSGSSSEWRPVVKRNNEFPNFPTARLHIPTVMNETGQYGIEIYKKASSGDEQKLVFSNFDAAELGSLLKPGTSVDAYFSLDPYDYKQHAGIRLVTRKLIIH